MATLPTDASTHFLTFAWAHPVSVLLGCFALRAVYLIWFHPLSDVPGPRLAALTDLWKSYFVQIGRISTALRDQHAIYGDVVRIGPNEVSIIAPEDVKTLYGHKSEYSKGPFYDGFSVGGPSVFSERDQIIHGTRRGAVAAAYSLNNLVPLERFCDKCTESLMHLLDWAAERATVLDIGELMDWYAYDTVGEIAFGSSFGLLANGADEAGLLSKLDTATAMSPLAGAFSTYGWLFTTRLGSRLASVLGGGSGPNFLVEYGSKIINSRQKTRKVDPTAYEEKKDMLYRFIESLDPDGTRSLSQPLLRNVLTIVFAGADTTKVSLTASLRYIYAHPPTLKHLREEIEEAIAAGNLSFPITYSQASRLEFLSACIKEAMRLNPAVGMPLQRVVPHGGRVIGKRFYRAGTLVGMLPLAIHLDTRAYGDDAEKWRPERWIEGDRRELEKYSLVFGQGSRICLGKNISLMEMSKLLPTIVHHYDITVKTPERPWNVHESWFAKQSDFFCSVSKRETGAG